jgi:uroporphyrinogen decarboxylase
LQGIKVLNPLKSVEDIDKLKTNIDVRKELHYVFEAISLTRHKLEGKVPLFGFSGAPVSPYV